MACPAPSACPSAAALKPETCATERWPSCAGAPRRSAARHEAAVLSQLKQNARRSVLAPLCAGGRAPPGLVIGLNAVTRALQLHHLSCVLMCQARPATCDGGNGSCCARTLSAEARAWRDWRSRFACLASRHPNQRNSLGFAQRLDASSMHCSDAHVMRNGAAVSLSALSRDTEMQKRRRADAAARLT